MNTGVHYHISDVAAAAAVVVVVVVVVNNFTETTEPVN